MAAVGPVSAKALLIAIATALIVGALGSLALRPPGGAGSTGDTGEGITNQQVRWRVTSAFTFNLPIIGPPPQRIADQLRTVSGGAFDMSVFQPGEIVPALAITESVKEGKVQAGYQWVGYDQGRIPASTLISAVPFGMEPLEFSAWWFYGGGQALGEELYRPHNVMPLLCGLTPPETAGWFRAPVESLDDLTGMKIRFAGIGGKVLQRLGASVTMIAPGEIFQALEKGAIDATEFSMPVVDQQLGFSRVAKYNYFPGWHQTFSTAHLQINLDAWNELSESNQALLRLTCMACALRTVSEAEALQGAVLRDYEAQGVITNSLSLEILEELRAATREVLDEEAANDESFAKILQSQREFSEVYRYWKIKGYLPRSF